MDIPKIGSEQNGEDPSTGIVPFGIIPTSFRIGQTQMGDASIAVVLELFCPNGLHITFWPSDPAVAFGQEMLNMGKTSKSGLLLPRFGGSGLKDKT